LETLSPHLRERSSEAANAWSKLGPLYADRALLCSAGLSDRVGAFIRLYRRGAYGEAGFWTFGAKAMMKDLVLGLLLAPVVERFGRPSSSSDRACRRGRTYLRTASTGQA
jgi:hypothetical protein